MKVPVSAHTASNDGAPHTVASPMPAEPGVWLFILADLCIFAMYFGVFTWEKSLYPEMFAEGQATLNRFSGGFNTVILLISSAFMASAVHAARAGEVASYRRWIKLTWLCGFLFLVVKVVEYREKFAAGYHVASNAFFRDYFIFTGFHLLHVLFGLCFLAYILLAFRNGERIRNNHLTIEAVGLYWHMVDLLWVILFSLIYLVP